MVSVVFFDVHGVLATDAMNPWYASVKKSHGLERLDAYHKIKDVFDAFEEGRLTEGQYWGEVSKRFGVDDSRAEAWRLLPYAYVSMIPGVKEILLKLKQRGIRIGMISNTSREWSAYIQSKVLPSAWFDPIILSFEVQKKKPHPSVFEAAAKAVGNLPPNEILFIDDMKKNTDGAASLGWDTALATSLDEIKDALEKRGLLG